MLTLSNLPVTRPDVLPLVAARPTSTGLLIVTAVSVPTCVQFVPLADRYARITLFDRDSFIQYGGADAEA
jgi:hypothetical protein